MLATLEVIRRASQAGPLGTVVVVGAGVGADVDSILAQEPARLIAGLRLAFTLRGGQRLAELALANAYAAGAF